MREDFLLDPQGDGEAIAHDPVGQAVDDEFHDLDLI